MTNKTWNMVLLIGTALMIFTAPAAAGNVYKWVDAEGRLHFSEQAPEGVQATKVTTDTRKVGTVEPTAAKAPPQRTEAQAGKENVVVQEKKLSRKEKKAMRAQLCKTARERIAQLEPKPKVLVREEDGTMRHLSDSERLERLQTAKNIEKEYCDN